jgi:hypothetical protein
MGTKMNECASITREEPMRHQLEVLERFVDLFVCVVCCDVIAYYLRRSTERMDENFVIVFKRTEANPEHVKNAVVIHYHLLPYLWNTIRPLLHVQQKEAPVTGEMTAADTPVHYHFFQGFTPSQIINQ